MCQLDNTTAIQDLNANVNADVVINLLSHEDSETITDPITPGSGWSTTGTGQEVGDNCERSARFDPAKGANPDAFLPTLGGSESAGTLYDQLINSHRYYLQSEWSNGNHNCEMRPTPGKITPRFTASRVHRAVTSRSFDPAASTSTHHLSSATWNFGDGSPTKFLFGTATLTRVKHRYNQAGHYTVTLTLIDNTGNLNTTTERVRIRNP